MGIMIVTKRQDVYINQRRSKRSQQQTEQFYRTSASYPTNSRGDICFTQRLFRAFDHLLLREGENIALSTSVGLARSNAPVSRHPDRLTGG